MTRTRQGWASWEMVALAALFIGGAAVRVVLLPSQGVRGDLDQYAGWVATVASQGFSHAYDGNLNYGPVVALAFGILGAIDTGFRTASDAADPTIRMLLKVPPVLADLGMAAVMVALMRRAPRWALVAAAGVLLNPAVILVSAWWGQYESVMTLWALAAVAIAVDGHPVVAGGAAALAVLTKPQGLALVAPLVAWTGGRRGIMPGLAAMAAMVCVAAISWLPFGAVGSIVHFVETVASVQAANAIVTINAWNMWALVQGPVAPGSSAIPDASPLLGPLTARALGLLLAGAATLILLAGTWRHPSRTALVVATAAGSLVAFAFLTVMRERYLFPAVVLPFAISWWRPALVAGMVLSGIFLLELLMSPGSGLVSAEVRDVIDLVRVPASSIVVATAILAVAWTWLGRLPSDREWDLAVGAPGAPASTAADPRA